MWPPSPTWRGTSPGIWTATGTDTLTGLENWILETEFYLSHCKTILTEVMMFPHHICNKQQQNCSDFDYITEVCSPPPVLDHLTQDPVPVVWHPGVDSRGASPACLGSTWHQPDQCEVIQRFFSSHKSIRTLLRHKIFEIWQQYYAVHLHLVQQYYVLLSIKSLDSLIS